MTSKEIKKYNNKSIPELLKLAQAVFNLFIRNRDSELACISCGGNANQAGHFYSAGNHSVHRFNEMNCHLQCVKCNMYLSGNLLEYRINLVKKIGEKNVQWLDDNRHRKTKFDKWTLIEIIVRYKALNKKSEISFTD